MSLLVRSCRTGVHWHLFFRNFYNCSRNILLSSPYLDVLQKLFKACSIFFYESVKRGSTVTVSFLIHLLLQYVIPGQLRDWWKIYTLIIRLHLTLLQRLRITIIGSIFDFLFIHKSEINRSIMLPMLTIDPDAMRLLAVCLCLLTTVLKYKHLIQMERYQLFEEYTVRITFMLSH